MRTIELLRKYCLSDTPVQLQVLSDQAANFSRHEALPALEKRSTDARVAGAAQ